jgi:hypothetical protein
MLDVSEGPLHEEDHAPTLVNGCYSANGVDDGEKALLVQSSDITRNIGLPSIDSTDVVSSFIPIVTPAADHAIVKENLSMVHRDA